MDCKGKNAPYTHPGKWRSLFLWVFFFKHLLDDGHFLSVACCRQEFFEVDHPVFPGQGDHQIPVDDVRFYQQCPKIIIGELFTPGKLRNCILGSQDRPSIFLPNFLLGPSEILPDPVIAHLDKQAREVAHKNWNSRDLTLQISKLNPDFPQTLLIDLETVEKYGMGNWLCGRPRLSLPCFCGESCSISLESSFFSLASL